MYFSAFVLFLLCLASAVNAVPQVDTSGADASSSSSAAASSAATPNVGVPEFNLTPPPPQPCPTCDGPPPSIIQPPPQTFQPPPTVFQPPPQIYQPPPQTYQPPPQTYQPPPQTYTYQPPPFVYQPPPMTYQSPPQTYQPPPQTFQPPPELYVPPPIIYRPPAPPTCNTCPCYWCLAQFGVGQRPVSAIASATSSGLGWANPSATAASAISGLGGGFGGSAASAAASAADGRTPFGGWFSDVNVEANSIKDRQTACLAFIEQYADQPLEPEKLAAFVGRTFYGNEKLQKKYAKGVVPSTFHCCHVEFGHEILHPAPKKPTNGAKISPQTTTAEYYMLPILPKDVTCNKLVDELFDEVSGKNKEKALAQVLGTSSTTTSPPLPKLHGLLVENMLLLNNTPSHQPNRKPRFG